MQPQISHFFSIFGIAEIDRATERDSSGPLIGKSAQNCSSTVCGTLRHAGRWKLLEKMCAVPHIHMKKATNN
jgi:hypothetical protein